MGVADMAVAMAAVLVVVLAIAWYSGTLSLGPPGGSDPEQTHTADIDAGFDHAASVVDFPLLIPRDLPDGWHPSSFTFDNPAAAGSLADTGPAVVRGGWVTQDGDFITLIESDASIGQLLAVEIGAGAGIDRGTVVAGGATWSITDGRRAETVWIRSIGATTVLITGDAPEDDFMTMARAIAVG